jgi:hypothetical protein
LRDRMVKHLPLIVAQAIDHKDQRYNTVGDYMECGRDYWSFTISKMNRDSEFAVLIHELIEMYLTQRRGLPEPEITKFDIESGLDDPGASRDAPYHNEHMFAEKIERLILKQIGMSWRDHIKAVEGA